ncbi:MAG: molecular chaperone DnaJ [Hyphomicrobiales bacterium]|nr:DnaJ domain-containing protein [Hyphomicrobiales bacterium]PCJ92251.1 MAG: molecular chaperone DnaJ [Hyphomicrobiales bacterium]
MSAEKNIFDKIRISPAKKRKRQKTANEVKPEIDTNCSHAGCEKKATNKAPRGRGRDGEYLWFCMEHVREYNKTYNYFSGMGDEAVAKFQKDSSLGHRPTWKMGVNNTDGVKEAGKKHDPFEFLAERARRRAAGGEDKTPDQRGRKLLNVEKKSLEALGLDGSATKIEIKKRFKELAKMHHPDVNGGDRGSEDRLRDVIQAYNYLKSAGFC